MDESNKGQTEQQPIIYSSVFQPYVEPNKGQELSEEQKEQLRHMAELLVPSYAKLDTSANPTADIVPPAVEEPVKRDWAWLHPIELIKGLFSPDRPDDSSKD